MDDDHDMGLYAMINGFSSTSTNDLNNNQMVDAINDWGTHGMANGFRPSIGASTPSFVATTTTFFPSIPIDNSQRVDTTIDPFLHGMVNGFQPNKITYPSSYVGDTTMLYTTPTMPIYNVQMSNENFNSDLNTIVNSHPPAIVGASSTYFVKPTSTPVTILTTTTTTNNNNPTMPIDVYHRQNSYFQEDRLNKYPMNIDNINEFLKKTDYHASLPIRQNPRLTCKILSNPCHGKLSEPSTPKNPLIGQFPPDFFACSKIVGESSSSNSDQRMKEFRVYRMPLMGLNTDVWSWEAYGEKMTDDSKRTYYKCTTRDDCTAKRRVEHHTSDSKSVTLKYSNNHNHPIPSLMNLPGVRVNVVRRPIEVVPSAPVVVVHPEENTEDDHIFEGLGEFIDI